MSSTSGSQQSFNTKCRSKYLFKSFETLETETTRHDLGLRPFNVFQKQNRNLAITCQNQLAFGD